jgi:hypothetical protein
MPFAAAFFTLRDIIKEQIYLEIGLTLLNSREAFVGQYLFYRPMHDAPKPNSNSRVPISPRCRQGANCERLIVAEIKALPVNGPGLATGYKGQQTGHGKVRVSWITILMSFGGVT